MKYTRIFLFLSPLLLFCPPLVPTHGGLAWTMIGSFYGLVLRRFPWNFLMAGLCYMYAQQLGRECYRWALASFAIPFFTPLVLAFMEPKYNSTAYNVQRALAKPDPVRGVAGSFQDRFPLLERCLAGKPEATHVEQAGRFAHCAANFEFAGVVPLQSIDGIFSEAQGRQLGLWTEPGDGGVRIYGAGLVQAAAFDEVIAWLKKIGTPGEKMTVASRQPDGTLKFIEYYPV